MTLYPPRQRDLDHQVRRLIKRHEQGHRITMGEAWKACPYRTFLYSTPDPTRVPDTPPSVALVMLGLGEIEPLSDRMRQDVHAAMDSGETVLLLSNRREQRDHTKRELGLAFCFPAGTA
jgi:hypothetical protein